MNLRTFVWKANVHEKVFVVERRMLPFSYGGFSNNFVMNVCVSKVNVKKLNNVRGLMWETISYVFKERIRHIRHRE